MAFPPFYPYPRFFTSAGNRLHPGQVYFGGGRGALAAGVLWRVTQPLGYPSVLHLTCVTQPNHFVRLNQPGERSWPPAAPCEASGATIASGLRLFPISEYFSYARFPKWYEKFRALGCELFAADYIENNVVMLSVWCRELPAQRWRIDQAVGRLWLHPNHPYEEELELQRLYEHVRGLLDAWAVEKLQQLRVPLRLQDGILVAPLGRGIWVGQ